MPFARGVNRCCSNIQSWLHNLNADYKRIFLVNGISGLCPIAFNKVNFYLDDDLPWEKIRISTATSPEEIVVEILKTKINPSRVFSGSMFIEPIALLRDHLAYDQIFEILLLASLLNTPYWFHYVVMHLARRHLSENDPFSFQSHPFYDIMESTIKTFGHWQTSLDHRFSPCGNSEDRQSIPDYFGVNKDEYRKRGEERLTNIVKVLLDCAEWIDTELFLRKDDPVNDIPLDLLIARLQCYCDQIRGCQFGLFRLGTVITYASGSGLFKSGRHLLFLAVPAPRCASSNHLLNPFGDEAEATNGIPTQHHCRAQNAIATKLGIEYTRYHMEPSLCEGSPRRDLQVCDWFRRGGSLSDLNSQGQSLYKKYGMGEQWKVLSTITSKKLSFLCRDEKDLVFLRDCDILFCPLLLEFEFLSPLQNLHH